VLLTQLTMQLPIIGCICGHISLQITQALNFAGHYWVIQLEQVPKIVICENSLCFCHREEIRSIFDPPWCVWILNDAVLSC